MPTAIRYPDLHTVKACERIEGNCSGLVQLGLLESSRKRRVQPEPGGGEPAGTRLTLPK